MAVTTTTKKPKKDSGGKESAAVWVQLEKLHGWENNPKKHPEAQIAELMRSIKRFGWGAVIIARKDGEIIAGHGRLEAANRLGLKTVPVRYMDLDPADAHLLSLADNRLNEVGEWDEELLASVLREHQDIDLTGLGWSESELANLMGISTESGDPDGKLFDESAGDGVDFVECPHCGGNVPV